MREFFRTRPESQIGTPHNNDPVESLYTPSESLCIPNLRHTGSVLVRKGEWDV